VKSATGVFRRDIRKLCLIEEELLKSIEESTDKDKTEHMRLAANYSCDILLRSMNLDLTLFLLSV
jgi:hypothetical protein